MADPPRPNPTSVAPAPIFYLLIDGTDAVDSAAFGAALEAAFPAFKNLAEQALGRQVDTSDASARYPSRLIDDDHALLPVWRLTGPAQKWSTATPSLPPGITTATSLPVGPS
jgi:hypothetical protein